MRRTGVLTVMVALACVSVWAVLSGAIASPYAGAVSPAWSVVAFVAIAVMAAAPVWWVGPAESRLLWTLETAIAVPAALLLRAPLAIAVVSLGFVCAYGVMLVRGTGITLARIGAVHLLYRATRGAILVGAVSLAAANVPRATVDADGVIVATVAGWAVWAAVNALLTAAIAGGGPDSSRWWRLELTIGAVDAAVAVTISVLSVTSGWGAAAVAVVILGTLVAHRIAQRTYRRLASTEPLLAFALAAAESDSPAEVCDLAAETCRAILGHEVVVSAVIGLDGTPAVEFATMGEGTDAPLDGGWVDEVAQALATTTTLAITAADRREQLREQALRDPLTGVHNRIGAERLGREIVTRSRRAGSDTAVAFIDLNGLKRANDEWGHDAGDALLVRAAGSLLEAVRPGDLVARLAGDEFLVVVEQVDARSVSALHERVEEALTTLPDGAAVGWAHGDEDGTTLSELQRVAEQRMRRAKEHHYAATGGPRRR